MNTSPMRVLSGFKEIASFLGLSTRTIFRHIDSIPVSRLGNKVMILESDLAGWVQGKSKQKRKNAMALKNK